MKVKGLTLVLAAIFYAAIVQGFPMFKGGRCLCRGSGIRAVKVEDIEEISIFYPSNNCDKTEVIMTLRAHKGKRCLNPKSKQGYFIIKKLQKLNFSKHQKV